MLDRILDLAEQLSAGGAPLASDEVGDDYEHAATALQALTAILVTRDLRTKMARWEWITNEKGKRVQRMRPENPPTPEEAAANAARFEEILASGQAPAVRVFNPESTTLRNPDGSPITSHGQYEAALKRKGLGEVSGYDVRNDTDVTPERDVQAEIAARQAETIQRAVAFGKETGQITPDNEVVEGAPVRTMPVQEWAGAVKVRPPVGLAADAAPVKPFEDIPLSQRKPVDHSKQIRKLTQGASERAIAAALARTGGF